MRGTEKTLLRIQSEKSQQKYYEGAKEGHLHQTRTEAGGILFSKVCGLEGAEDGDESAGALE